MMCYLVQIMYARSPTEFCHFVWVCQKTLPQSTRLVFTLHISNRWPIPAIVSLGFYLCQLSIGSIIFVVLVYFIDLFTRSIIFVVVWFYLVVHSLDPYVIICYVWTISFAYRLGWYIFVVFELFHLPIDWVDIYLLCLNYFICLLIGLIYIAGFFMNFELLPILTDYAN